MQNRIDRPVGVDSGGKEVGLSLLIQTFSSQIFELTIRVKVGITFFFFWLECFGYCVFFLKYFVFVLGYICL